MSVCVCLSDAGNVLWAQTQHAATTTPPHHVVQIVAAKGSDARQTYAKRFTQQVKPVQVCRQYITSMLGAAGRGGGRLLVSHACVLGPGSIAFACLANHQRERRYSAASGRPQRQTSLLSPKALDEHRLAPHRGRRAEVVSGRHVDSSAQPRTNSADRRWRRRHAPSVSIHCSDPVGDGRASQASQNTCWASPGCTAHRPRFEDVAIAHQVLEVK